MPLLELLELLELLLLELLEEAPPPAPPAPPMPPSPLLLDPELDELPDPELLLLLVVVLGFSSTSPQAMKMPPESATQINPHAFFFIVSVSSMLRQTEPRQLGLAKKALCRKRIIRVRWRMFGTCSAAFQSCFASRVGTSAGAHSSLK